MGPSPPPPPSSSLSPQSRPSSSSSSLPRSLSGVDNWFLNSSDRDTQIFTEALTRELSSCSRGPPSSSVYPSPATSASFPSSSSLYETFGSCLEGRPWQSQSSQALFLVKALQQQQQQQQQQQHYHYHHQQQAAAMSSMRFHGDGSSHVEQIPLQKGSPISSSSSPPLSASTETPASPFSSTLSTNSAMSTIAHSKPQHQDSQDGLFARSMTPSLKPPEASSMYSDSSLSSKAASMALSSQASVGVGDSKVNKRRSRASNKAPIAVLSADASNFRAMVQQLTGIPSMQSYTHSGIPLLKPQPIRHPFTSTSNLPTLDTSACFLGPKYMKEGISFAQKPQPQSSTSAANLNPFSGVDVLGCNAESNTLQSLLSSYVKQSVFNEQVNSINHWKSADSLKARGNLSSVCEGEQISVRQNSTPNGMTTTTNTLDSLPMESSFNAVDARLSFDATLAIQGPSMELARMA